MTGSRGRSGPSGWTAGNTSDVSLELAVTSGAMTHLMDALERAGLIERASDPSDRRGTLAVLTRRGRGVVEEALAAHLKLEAQIAAHLSKAERAQLANLLKKMLLSMEVEDAGGQ